MLLLPGAVLALFAIHGLVLRYVSTSLALPAMVTLGAVVLVFLKHLGVLGSLLAAIRNRTWSKRS